MSQAIIEMTSMEKKSYAVSIKGLIMHFVDVLFVTNKASSYSHDASNLSAHLQKDLGIY